MTLELATATAGALFVFFLILLIFGTGKNGSPSLSPKNPIGFSPS